MPLIKRALGPRSVDVYNNAHHESRGGARVFAGGGGDSDTFFATSKNISKNYHNGV